MISRDGICTSLWQENATPYITAHQTVTHKGYDMVVVGGGITGITTALLLQRSGKKCLLIEARNIGFGTTGGTTAHLNTLLDTPYSTISRNFGEDAAKLVSEAAGEAIELIKKNVRELDIDCSFKETPAYLFSKDDEQTKILEDIYKGAQKVDLPVAYSEKIPAPMLFRKAMRIDKQARFNPIDYIYALAKAFEAAGGMILQNTRVTGIEGDDLLKITTIGGEFETRAVFLATHIPIGVNLLHLRCAPLRSYAAAVKLKRATDYPSALLYDCADPYHYYRTQEIKGSPYLIVGGYDHRTALEANTEKQFRELESHIRSYYDVDEIAYTWSSQYYEPVDGLPYIGHLPGHGPNVLTATGFGGNGMIYSHVAGITVSHIVSGNDHPYIKLFDPNRVKPVAGFTNFIKHNAVAAGALITKLWPADQLQAFAEIAPGDSKIVRYEDHTIAVHKDEKGNLHTLFPECTHLKCTIAWNSAENSWDCPCHGARFSIDGEVLNGPASVDLVKAAIG